MCDGDAAHLKHFVLRLGEHPEGIMTFEKEKPKEVVVEPGIPTESKSTAELPPASVVTSVDEKETHYCFKVVW
jgi:hypothetical protein